MEMGEGNGRNKTVDILLGHLADLLAALEMHMLVSFYLFDLFSWFQFCESRQTVNFESS